MIDFLSYLSVHLYPDLLPLVGMFAVLLSAAAAAIAWRSVLPGPRILSVVAIGLLTLSVGLHTLQPIVQVYLEQELGMIFLEANKYTALMRNARYVVYPAGMLCLGIAIFKDRDEASSSRTNRHAG